MMQRPDIRLLATGNWQLATGNWQLATSGGEGMVAPAAELAPVENPLRQGMRTARTPQPCTMVIFGAAGDLTRRKLLPALYNLALEGWLPSGFSAVGFARNDLAGDEFG